MLRRVLLPTAWRRWNAPAVYAGARCSSSSSIMESPEVRERMTEFQEAFAEARLLIAECEESAGTVYFSEDLEDATEQTKATMAHWDNLRALFQERKETAALEQLRKEYEVKLKQLELELERARDAADH